jgi:hypothetical protein
MQDLLGEIQEIRSTNAIKPATTYNSATQPTTPINTTIQPATMHNSTTNPTTSTNTYGQPATTYNSTTMATHTNVESVINIPSVQQSTSVNQIIVSSSTGKNDLVPSLSHHSSCVQKGCFCGVYGNKYCCNRCSYNGNCNSNCACFKTNVKQLCMSGGQKK